ncbi:hypothetical protein BECAL_02972 [Bellilinea caldifistulae]|nr:hypothetical protein BECAL_02972 [Bellilinea caldifistulae]
MNEWVAFTAALCSLPAASLAIVVFVSYLEMRRKDGNQS